MDYVTIIIGIICIGYAFFSALMRIKKPEIFKKLEPMKKRWGEKNGSMLHFFGYVIVPIIFGTILLISGYFGKTFLRFSIREIRLTTASTCLGYCHSLCFRATRGTNCANVRLAG